MPQIIRLMTGILPFYFFYFFIGMSLFYQSDHFSTVSSTVTTLWSVMLGDSIKEVTLDISHISFSHIYMFSYVFLHYVVVHSIIVAMICDRFRYTY